MAIDRLAARRAAQQQETPASYPTRASGNGGYQRPHAQVDGSYEMSNVAAIPDDMEAFYSEISKIQQSIKTFNENVVRIGDLHNQSLNAGDSTAQGNNELADLVKDTSALSSTLKNRIKKLEAQGGTTRDAVARQQQTGVVKAKFMEAIQNYQKVEQTHRTKYKQRIERQLRIVNPDATPAEVKQAANDPQSNQIFTKALLNSNPTTAREVQNRHDDIVAIEQTLRELAQLFNDMGVLVNQQDETIKGIEAQAAAVEHDTEHGLKHTDDAVKSARAARKKRWICFIILVLLIVVIAGGLGGYFASQPKK